MTLKMHEIIGKTYRVLNIYERLKEGKTLVKREEAGRFGVDERTIQRDLDDIRAYLAEGGRDGRELVYDRKKRGYLLRSLDK